MIYFNDSTIYVGYIKQLLHSFNLPQCKVYNEKDSYSVGDSYIRGNSLYIIDKDGKEKRTGNYILGDYIENITKTLDLKNAEYDNHTHNYLGEYLRFIRDYTGLDMMSMYNCFGYQIPKNIDISFKIASSDKEIDVKSNALDYTLYIVNVRYDKEYTIAIDCQTQIEMFCGFYDSGNYIESEIYDENELESLTYFKSSGNRFKYPFKYSKLMNIDKKDFQHEKFLRLFIKIPVGCSSSVVVLEGDYLKDTEMYIKGDTQVLSNSLRKYDYKGKTYGNYDYVSKRQLLDLNTKGKFLLADRLVEYLSDQVITQNDAVINNVKKLQLKLKELFKKGLNEEPFRPFEYYGIWDNRMREAIYEFICKNNLQSKYKDLLYYCDKDVEINMGGLSAQINVEW